MPLDLKKLQNVDPLKRLVEKQTEQAEFSPMDPPDVYQPPALDPVPYEEMPPVLRQFMDEHRVCLDELKRLEEVIARYKTVGMKPESEKESGFSRFFRFFDENIVQHNLKEEKILFPTLQKHLMKNGEHSKGPVPKTAVDMLEDDHSKLLQLAAVTFNFLGLAPRLPDAASRAVTLDAALEQARSLVEALRLHIFREDNVIFPLAVKYLSPEELKAMNRQLSKFKA